MPESFKVLVKELQSLSLDVRVYTEENRLIDIKESMEEEIEPVDTSGSDVKTNDLFDEMTAEETSMAAGFTEVRFDTDGQEVEVAPSTGDENADASEESSEEASAEGEEKA